MATFEWNGDQIKTRMRAATKLGIDKTMSDCVQDARSGHEQYPPASEPGERFANRDNFAVSAIDIKDGARLDDDGNVRGTWGSDAAYSLYLEIGTSTAGSGEPRAQEREAMGDGNMDAIPGPSDPPLMAARPTLRPAADTHYPSLGSNIGAAFRGEDL